MFVIYDICGEAMDPIIRISSVDLASYSVIGCDSYISPRLAPGKGKKGLCPEPTKN